MTPVDSYLLELPDDKRVVLQRVRAQIAAIVPETTEQISYGMPAFKYHGKYLIAYAAFKDHFSLFPGALPEAAVARLTGFKMSKGTIWFQADQPVPEIILRHILAARVAEIDRNAKARR